MNSQHSKIAPRLEDKWLEKSLVAPSHPLLYERSDGEKAASEDLIREKAKTEWWNREITRLLYTLKILVFSVPVSFVTGVWIGIWFSSS